jgi:ABC-type branched-subunit amino acid transport system substrate-binding protein
MRVILNVFLGIFLSFGIPKNFYADEENKASTASVPDKLQIGAILPLSGEIAWFGKACLIGMQMAIAEGAGDKLSFLVEDDLSVQKKATLAAAKKLIQSGSGALLITAVPSAAAISSFLERNPIPALVLMDSNKSILDMNENILGFGFSNEQVGRDMAEHLVRSPIFIPGSSWEHFFSKLPSCRPWPGCDGGAGWEG